jgi:transposase
VPLYRAAPAAVQSAAAADQLAAVACRCCPGGVSRSQRQPRYPSDMTDAEWAVCEPVLPPPAWLAGKGGRPAASCMRDVVDAIRYLTHNGPVWRALPADFPPAGTVYWWVAKWQADGSTESMHGQLRERVRLLAGRTAMPTAAIIDSQSVKAAEEVARIGRGYDAGKKINGRKRHIAVDTIGLVLSVLITAASVQDRDAARPLLWNLRKDFPKVKLAWADGGYAGKLVSWSKTALKLTVQIVKRPDDLHTFKVLPRRWVVERTLAWITRHRRTVRDYERLPDHHQTYIYWAMIIVMTRRLARRSEPASASPEWPAPQTPLAPAVLGRAISLRSCAWHSAGRAGRASAAHGSKDPTRSGWPAHGEAAGAWQDALHLRSCAGSARLPPGKGKGPPGKPWRKAV